jgi:membrane fusion protein (multidrug efflux system)
MFGACRLLAAVALGVVAAGHCRAGDVPAHRIAVQVVPATVGQVQERLASYGTIEPRAGVDLSPQSAGHITAILFNDGDAVRKGQPLVRLDDRVARTQLQSAQAKSDLDRANLSRTLDLNAKGIKSASAVEEMRANLTGSMSSEKARQAQLDLMTVAAPFDGVLGPRRVEVGSFVQPGQTVVRLEDRTQLRVPFRVAEKLLPRLRRGCRVEAWADSLGSSKLVGTLTVIDPSAEPESRSILLRADFPEADGRAYSGLFVHVEVILAERQDALLIPQQAVLTSLSGAHVFRVEGGVARRTPIVTGAKQGDGIEVVSGLAPGDQVVVAGHFKLEDGAAVDAVPAPR